jgi:hypothetical protein
MAVYTPVVVPYPKTFANAFDDHPLIESVSNSLSGVVLRVRFDDAVADLTATEYRICPNPFDVDHDADVSSKSVHPFAGDTLYPSMSPSCCPNVFELVHVFGCPLRLPVVTVTV